MSWKKGNTRGTHYFNDGGDEIRLTKGTFRGKPIVKVMLKQRGSYWMKYGDFATEQEAIRHVRSIIKKQSKL